MESPVYFDVQAYVCTLSFNNVPRFFLYAILVLTLLYFVRKSLLSYVLSQKVNARPQISNAVLNKGQWRF